MRLRSLRIVAWKRGLPPRLSYIKKLSADARAVRDNETLPVSSSLPAIIQLAGIDAYIKELRPPDPMPSITEVMGPLFEHRLSIPPLGNLWP